MTGPLLFRIGLASAAVLALISVTSLPAARAGVVSLPVPRVTVYPGDLMTPGLLRMRRFRERAVTSMPVARRTEDIVGRVAKRTLLRGKLIALHALREPHVVEKGQLVRVIFTAAGLSITARATSLRSGGIGDVVPARNVDSGKIVSGIVSPDGTLRVTTP